MKVREYVVESVYRDSMQFHDLTHSGEFYFDFQSWSRGAILAHEKLPIFRKFGHFGIWR